MQPSLSMAVSAASTGFYLLAEYVGKGLAKKLLELEEEFLENQGS